MWQSIRILVNLPSVAAVTAAILLSGCAPSGQTSTATATVTATPSAITPSPTTTLATHASPITQVEAAGLVAALVIHDQPDFWHECTGGCPITPRLANQLPICCRGGPPILRENYFKGPPRVISVSATVATVDAQATSLVRVVIPIDAGFGPAAYDLAVSMYKGHWAVDDVLCSSQALTSSAYNTGGPEPFFCR
jgi:hypothetical protein